MLETDNLRIVEFSPLVSPARLKADIPSSEALRRTVVSGREAIRAMIHGEDRRRLTVVVGPCSIHDPEAAYEYAERLRRVAKDTEDTLLIVMRTYFEKPRTVVGWKGLVSDPRLDGSCDLCEGLVMARAILQHISGTGLPCATEFLDTVVPHYISDMVTWAAIGARTTESQIHRQMASGLSMPVGFKNSTDGSLQNAMNAVMSVREPHAFLGIDADGVSSVVRTTGNPDAHVVLRGGAAGPNYQAKHIDRAASLTHKEGLARAVMVDCSHDNSGKDPTRQPAIFAEVVKAFIEGQTAILGAMIESNLNPGKQAWAPGKALAYGVSITDGCVGWAETERMLYDAAALLAKAQTRDCAGA